MAVEFPRFLQTKTYSAKLLRDVFLDAPIQNGVVNTGDLMVTQRAAGANMSVDVAAGSAWVKGTSSARQGIYNVYNDATVNLALVSANPTNPRVDQIILRVYDSSDGGSAQDLGAVEVVTGTATAGATLTNRNGAAVLPAHSILLADVLVGAAAGSVGNTVIRDRRLWARGGYLRKLGGGGGNYTTTSTAYINIDQNNVAGRLELSGAPVRFSLRARVSQSAANNPISVTFVVNGVQLAAAGSSYDSNFVSPMAGSSYTIQPTVDLPNPTPGSALVIAQWATSAGTATMLNTAAAQPELVVQELLRANSGNNTVTTG